jgi:hypothetical protein
LVEGQISKFVADEQCRLGIGLEFADEGMIDLGGEQVIEHVHCGGKQDALIGLAGARQPTILDKKVLPTPGFPMRTRLVPLAIKVRSSRRNTRFLFCERLL